MQKLLEDAERPKVINNGSEACGEDAEGAAIMLLMESLRMSEAPSGDN